MSSNLRPTIISRRIFDEEGVHRANVRVEITPVLKKRYYLQHDFTASEPRHTKKVHTATEVVSVSSVSSDDEVASCESTEEF